MNTIKFSTTKRIAARISMLIGLILSIAIFFMPILRIEENDNIGDQEFTMVMAISPFQFLTGDTVVQPKVVGGTAEENEFLEMFLKEEDFLEVAWEEMSEDEFSDTLKTINSIKPIMASALLLFYIIALLINATINISHKKENCIYFEKIYGIFNLDMFAISFLCTCSTIITIFMYYSHTCQAKNINYIVPTALIIITLLLASGVIRNIIVHKERKVIFSDDFHFDNTELKKKITLSDIIHPAKKSSATNLDELYKYKQLLDDGVITEEEFKEKKEKILNSDKN